MSISNPSPQFTPIPPAPASTARKEVDQVLDAGRAQRRLRRDSGRRDIDFLTSSSPAPLARAAHIESTITASAPAPGVITTATTTPSTNPAAASTYSFPISSLPITCRDSPVLRLPAAYLLASALRTLRQGERMAGLGGRIRERACSEFLGGLEAQGGSGQLGSLCRACVLTRVFSQDLTIGASLRVRMAFHRRPIPHCFVGLYKASADRHCDPDRLSLAGAAAACLDLSRSARLPGWTVAQSRTFTRESGHGEVAHLIPDTLTPRDVSVTARPTLRVPVSVPWDSINAENIEILDVNGVPDPGHSFGTEMDLTVLPNLRILRIQFVGLIRVGMLDCLAPIILGAPHLHTLVLALVSEYDNDSKAQLAVLESALLPLVSFACPVVEVAYWDDDFTEDELKGVFPQLLARDMLRFVGASSARTEPYLEDVWWHETIRKIETGVQPGSGS
ncbi:hypothetical protein R3P38DRAFT_3243546 [Favolaschia claudopus]|uniref:Proteophosphoglycan ppg4 n=1 Tax=Favolaschia claudopus TaxID=2862362 RepID=A0AAV9Z2Z8_9AGAR